MAPPPVPKAQRASHPPRLRRGPGPSALRFAQRSRQEEIDKSEPSFGHLKAAYRTHGRRTGRPKNLENPFRRFLEGDQMEVLAVHMGSPRTPAGSTQRVIHVFAQGSQVQP